MLTGRRPSQRRGNVVVATAVSLTMLDQRRQVQAACDTAALAAADQLYADWLVKNEGVARGSGHESSPNGPAHTSAKTIATANGYTNAGTTTVAVNIESEITTGSFANKAGCAEVLISVQQPRYFSQLFGTTTLPIGGRAVARGQRTDQGNAIIILDPVNYKGALTGGGNGTITVNGAPIQVNSSNSQAIVPNGNGHLQVPKGFLVNGSPGTDLSQVSQGPTFDYTRPIVGPVTSGAPQISDPLRYLPEPDPTTLTPRASSATRINGNQTLEPGVYVGGISMSQTNASLTMNPGLYYIDGGGFNITGGSVTTPVTGSGVTIFNKPYANSDAINISSDVTLFAQKTGTYQGVLVFQSRTATVQPEVSIQGNATALVSLTGTFYAPKADMKVTGNGVMTVNAQFIANHLTLGGSGTTVINWDPTLLPGIRNIRLVE